MLLRKCESPKPHEYKSHASKCYSSKMLPTKCNQIHWNKNTKKPSPVQTFFHIHKGLPISTSCCCPPSAFWVLAKFSNQNRVNAGSHRNGSKSCHPVITWRPWFETTIKSWKKKICTLVSFRRLSSPAIFSFLQPFLNEPVSNPSWILLRSSCTTMIQQWYNDSMIQFIGPVKT